MNWRGWRVLEELLGGLTFGQWFVVGGVIAFMLMATAFCNGYMNTLADGMAQKPPPPRSPRLLASRLTARCQATAHYSR